MDYLAVVIILGVSLLAKEATPEDVIGGLQEYCQLEKFTASCRDNEVIIIKEASYGRMRKGKCIKKDYGSLGCKTNVLPEMDRKCSGRHECAFMVADLHGTTSCPDDLTNNLEASHECLPVTVPNEASVCTVGTPVRLPDQSGFIANAITKTKEYGSERCPWLIQGRPGQRVNITVINFARAPNVGGDQENAEYLQQSPRICYQFAVIRDGGTRRAITECEGGPRMAKAYLSNSHSVDIAIIDRKDNDIYFMLQYEIIGCPNPRLPKGSWIRRVGDNAIIKCNFTEESWVLTCNGDTWSGELGNCSQDSDGSSSIFPSGGSFPYGILIVVAIGVALGVFFGGILLTLASIYMKRKRAEKNQSGIPAGERVYDFPETGKRLDSIQHPYPYGHPYGPHSAIPVDGVDVGIIDPRMKDTPIFDPQYQQYGAHINGNEYPEYRGSEASSHIYESPKFGRKILS